LNCENRMVRIMDEFVKLFQPRIYLIGVVILLISLHANGAGPDLSIKKHELSDVNARIDTLRQMILQNQHYQLNLQQQLKTTEIKFGRLSEDVSQLTKSLESEKHILLDVKITQEKTQATLQKQNIALANQFRAAYQLNVAQPLKIILNQQNPSSISRHVVYYRYLTQSRLQLIDDIKQNLSLLAKSINASTAHQQTLKKLVLKKQNQQDHLQRTLDLRTKIIDALGLQTKSKEQQMNSLTANQKNLQETIEKLKQQSITITGESFDKLRGKLFWPVKGTIMLSYGKELDVGKQRSSGVMIKAQPGTPVTAISSGKIIFADWLRGFGLLVIINHGNDYMSLYGRNRVIYAKVGQSVQKGDSIAAIGNSGGYEKSSLYFEIRKHGSPIDPHIWCK
jgi:septal ring factor EnvC (AmiA/AmiB activator)